MEDTALLECEFSALKTLIGNHKAKELLEQHALDTQDFAHANTQAIFKACRQILSIQPIITPQQIAQCAPKQKQDLQEIMGVDVPNSDFYIAFLKQESHRRALQKMSEAIQQECSTIAHPKDIHTQALQDLEDIGREYASCADLIHDGARDDIALLQDIERYEKGELGVIPSGYLKLDALSGGFKPGDQIIVGASTSMGKTAFALNLALQIPLKNPQNGVLFCSLEMTRTAISLRLVSLLEGVPLKELKDLGKLGPKRKDAITRAMQKRKNMPLYTYNGARDLSAIIAAITAATRQQNIKVAIIDYLQLIELQEESLNLHTKLSKISSALKTCATQNNITIIALSQVKRAVNEREDRRPLLSDLKESGSIEQDADMVIFLHRDFKHARDRIFTEAAKRFGSLNIDKKNNISSNKYERDQFVQEALQKLEADHVNGCHEAELIVAKNRDGETGTAKTWFYPPFMRFTDDPDNHTIAIPSPQIVDDMF
ncbi:DnaB-like helicase C-terminal domain-containing protein [Helicobacter felis]|uniref:DnaB-like helicase C-terminal domain-containing protein n=1 Tax=Helicobacter felis TaxID=214 RepID=UPI000CF0299A|nr:DnaB-like helicase C-terminal domain-containing protein [Helicobacter felis]